MRRRAWKAGQEETRDAVLEKVTLALSRRMKRGRQVAKEECTSCITTFTPEPSFLPPSLDSFNK